MAQPFFLGRETQACLPSPGTISLETSSWVQTMSNTAAFAKFIAKTTPAWGTPSVQGGRQRSRVKASLTRTVQQPVGKRRPWLCSAVSLVTECPSQRWDAPSHGPVQDLPPSVYRASLGWPLPSHRVLLLILSLFCKAGHAPEPHPATPEGVADTDANRCFLSYI